MVQPVLRLYHGNEENKPRQKDNPTKNQNERVKLIGERGGGGAER